MKEKEDINSESFLQTHKSGKYIEVTTIDDLTNGIRAYIDLETGSGFERISIKARINSLLDKIQIDLTEIRTLINQEESK